MDIPEATQEREEGGTSCYFGGGAVAAARSVGERSEECGGETVEFTN